MAVSISNTAKMLELFQDAAGLKNAAGNPRNKQIVLRILQETAGLIEELDISDDEFWAGVEYINRLGKSNEAGLLVAGLGVEHFLDLLNDARQAEAGRTGGTPRTIEGPLYVAGAPLSQGYARMDDGAEDDVATPMFVEGQILDLQGQPIAGALVDLWQADSQGNYSHFDKCQSEFNLRRRIVTDAEGRYRVRSIVPSGYGCNPQGPTQECLNQLGRHGQRPAHIHFFVSAPGYEHLTTQINLSNDAYLWDDFAYATRDGLIGEVQFIDDQALAAAHQVPGRFAQMKFDFQLRPAANLEAEQRSNRPRALQEA
ncbi:MULTISPECIES: catechol 1,2-dioxygenase [Gammaproteobacteria]|jgi:catechol 1,2-dioxygenase|uniref:catechol 1,2-dioxygenase n=1 Tax=Gammaproteobacteria TaxID=1236 RepID=UPI00191467E5|nr:MULTISPECIES: catechol 1,2-dioxygenase [Gammaproteobacteria]MBK5304500.1 catechol 1,2-dioxygenase [Bacillus sp. TH86]MBK5324269.1 catechol 1,2-dioxygenase [Bacillus sp. TH59]MBK5339219.1 catechol 1,2-dioxygenase [Bacillus sp. TH57]MBK5313267.1 catechol 1,2-dioxygenase [Pseudomonas sp. TH71]MBK5318766.1 catechol 1,2-dioxygenase [Erwinia sp. TH79]